MFIFSLTHPSHRIPKQRIEQDHPTTNPKHRILQIDNLIHLGRFVKGGELGFGRPGGAIVSGGCAGCKFVEEGIEMIHDEREVMRDER